MDETERRLLKPGEVAALFRVTTRTICRWTADGKIPSVKTMGGHNRYWSDDIERLLEQADKSGS